MATSEVKRGSAAIEARMRRLEDLIANHDIWVDTGIGRVPEPESRRRQDLFRIRLSELRWVLGEDVDLG